MSKRRKIGDVVRVKYPSEVEPDPFVAQIVESGSGPVPEDCIRDCGDPDCKEWQVVHEIGSDGKPNGERQFHISECAMFDIEQASKKQGKPTMLFDESYLVFSSPQGLDFHRFSARGLSAGGWSIGEKFDDRFDTEVGGFSQIAKQWFDGDGKMCGDWERTATGEIAAERNPSVIVDYDNGAKRYTEADAEGVPELASVLVRLRGRETAYVAFLAEKEAAKARREARKRLYQTELHRYGVRFLPAQVMRQIFTNAGV
jgi:hypothetical protein